MRPVSKVDIHTVRPNRVRQSIAEGKLPAKSNHLSFAVVGTFVGTFVEWWGRRVPRRRPDQHQSRA
jgi:hypothetical protein